MINDNENVSTDNVTITISSSCHADIYLITTMTQALKNPHVPRIMLCQFHVKQHVAILCVHTRCS